VKTQRSADTASGLFLVFFGLVVLYAATKITGGMEERLPPRTLPYFLGTTVLLAGLLLAIKSWRYRGQNLAIKWPDRKGFARVLVAFVSLIIYTGLIDPLGMPLATAIFVAFLVWSLWRRRHAVLYALLTGVISGVVVFYLFMRFLELNFPAGFLAP
jgi:hypothetical protein